MQAIIKLPQLIDRTKVSRAAIYAMMARGEFPRPVRLGRRSVGWRVEDIDAWIADRPEGGSWRGEAPINAREGEVA
jgi:prophage regulatory protein